jgi:hypothetical protein
MADEDNSLGDVVNKLKDIENLVKKGSKDSKSDKKESSFAISKLGESIKGSLGTLKSSITAPFAALKNTITAPFEGIKSALTAPFDSLKKGFSGIGNFFKNKKEQKSLQGLAKSIDELKNALLVKFDKLTNFQDLANAIFELKEAVIDKLGNLTNFQDLSESIVELKDSLLVKLDSLTDGGNDLKDAENRKEQKALLVRIAESLENMSSAPSSAGGDVKASGGVGALGKIGKSLGAGIGGLVKGIGAGFAAVGKNFGRVIKGAIAIAAIGASLIPAAKAFQEFGEVTWDAVKVGLTVLAGLTVAAAALSFASPAILIGAAAIGILALAMLPAAKAFEMFGAALNEHVMPALKQFQPIINDFIDRLIVNFESLSKIVQGFIGGTIDVLVTAFERASSAIGGLIQTISTEIQELGALDGASLLSVAAGITAVGGALAAFGAGGAVGKILGSIGEGFAKLFGAESPIEQLKSIAAIGPDLERGIAPLEKLPTALSNISEALKTGFKTEIQDAGDAIHDLLKDIDKGLDKIDFKKLDKVTGLIIHRVVTETADVSREQAEAKSNSLTNTIVDSSTMNAPKVESVTYNDSGLIDRTANSFAY